MKDDLKKVSKAHTIYKLSDGTRVPGTTTILGVLNKPALVPWANKLGLEGIDSSKYVDESARIGTLAHYLVQCHLTKQEPDLSQYGIFEIDKAENALISYFEWEKTRKIVPIKNELPLISETYRYGGTIDLYAEIDGILTLCDFKTGSGIYNEHYYQVCAYRQLLIENGDSVEQIRILNIPRKESEEFTEKVYTNFGIGWEIFCNCLNIYELQKSLKI
ncbi:MAG: hypothetical protein PHS93_09765 [Candidatus Omnitrophica bacterium]|nr:hypothetical protein [Candidatus Omnitrophota bacterium]